MKGVQINALDGRASVPDAEPGDAASDAVGRADARAG